MKTVMEACFENGKEGHHSRPAQSARRVEGGWSTLDADLMSEWDAFAWPYVHGLTMGELAMMAKEGLPPGGSRFRERARARPITVIPMRG